MTSTSRRPAVGLLLALALVAAPACAGSDEDADGDPLVGATTTVPAAEEDLILAQFTAQADLSSVDATASWEDQGEQVVEALQATATQSQRQAIELAEEAGVPTTSYWLTNALVFEGDRDLAERVSRLPGVASVQVEPVHEPVRADDLTAVDADDVPEVPWSTSIIGAPQAWASGHRGEGAAVGVVDTGIDAGHPALRSSWSGHWFDATATCPDAPCDPQGHGTAVAGLAVGGDPDDPSVPAIGVAPAATVLAARACSDDGCRASHLLAALQWMLAPTGDDGQPDPSQRPAVVVGSWELPDSDDALNRVPAVLEAAGMVAVMAAGDAGPTCATVGQPASQPGAVAVGASTDDDGVADASSRGPVRGGAAKPDLVAPGVDVVSAAPDGGWASGSGTSLAAPLVGGALALTATGDRPPPPAQAVAALLAAAQRLDVPDACGTGGQTPSTLARGNDTSGAGRLDVAALVARTGGQTDHPGS